jgi:hypothetical protein
LLFPQFIFVPYKTAHALTLSKCRANLRQAVCYLLISQLQQLAAMCNVCYLLTIVYKRTGVTIRPVHTYATGALDAFVRYSTPKAPRVRDGEHWLKRGGMIRPADPCGRAGACRPPRTAQLTAVRSPSRCATHRGAQPLAVAAHGGGSQRQWQPTAVADEPSTAQWHNRFRRRERNSCTESSPLPRGRAERRRHRITSRL